MRQPSIASDESLLTLETSFISKNKFLRYSWSRNSASVC